VICFWRGTTDAFIRNSRSSHTTAEDKKSFIQRDVATSGANKSNNCKRFSAVYISYRCLLLFSNEKLEVDDFVEEWVFFDLSCTRLATSEASLRVRIQQLLHNVNCIGTHVRWKPDIALSDGTKHNLHPKHTNTMMNPSCMHF
jgi:hypothetical protein